MQPVSPISSPLFKYKCNAKMRQAPLLVANGGAIHVLPVAKLLQKSELSQLE